MIPTKTLRLRGRTYQVARSTANGKKFMAVVDGKVIHFGAKGYTIAPGTRKGDNYCARSSGIKDGNGISANDLSRAMWRCKGKKSLR